MATGAELIYQTKATALQMANAIFGDGVSARLSLCGYEARVLRAESKVV